VPEVELIAWDFDGVLNRNIVKGEFVWHQSFETDIGASVQDFQQFIFHSGRFHDVLIGKRDLLDLLAQWIKAFHVALSPEQVLTYWLEKDAKADEEVLSWLTAARPPSVIATNNEAHRARYIWDEMGYSRHMKKMFAAGPMGKRKPDAGFFQQIEDWSGLPSERLLLIDDAEANVTAARKRGWQTFCFTNQTRHRLPSFLGIAK
jgi:putative hydrolase of the HAD superfamily